MIKEYPKSPSMHICYFILFNETLDKIYESQKTWNNYNTFSNNFKIFFLDKTYLLYFL